MCADVAAVEELLLSGIVLNGECVHVVLWKGRERGEQHDVR